MQRIEKIAVICIVVMTLTIVIVPQNFMVMLLTAFAYQLMAAAMGLACWMFLRGRHRLGVMSGICGFLLAPLFIGLDTSEPNQMQAEGLRVAHFNVLKYTSNRGPTLSRAAETGADLLSFQEVDRAWADSLVRVLSEDYPFYKIVPDEGSKGIAVFSRFPLNEVTVWYSDYMPNIMGNINVDGQTVSFIASHTRAPITPYAYTVRNRHLRAIAYMVERLEGPVLMMGDLNTVPWDDHLLEFKADTNLLDSRKSLAPTYPRGLPLARIPIDYIFHSEQLQCMGFTTVGGVSSDHLGVMGVYQFVKGGKA